MLVILLLLISSAYIELTGHIEGTAQGDNLNFRIVIYYNNTRYLLANHIFFATNGTYSCYGYTDQRGLGSVTMGRPFFISVPSFVPTSYGKNNFASNSFYREVGLNFFNVTGICPGSRNSLDSYVKLVRESDLQVLQEPWWAISTTPTFQYHLDREVNSTSADFLALTVAIVAFIVLAVIRDPSILGWLDFSKFIYNVPYNPPSTEMTVNKGNITQTEKGHSIIQDESDKRLTDEHNKFTVIGNLSTSLAQAANQVGLGLIGLAYLIEESDKSTKTPKQDPEKPEQQELTDQNIAPTGQDSTSVQSLDEVSGNKGGQELTEYDPGFVPGQTFTGQDSDLTGQGSVDVQSLETSTEIGRELYREGERELFVQDGQTGQDVVPGQTFTGQDSDLTGQGSVDVQSLETSTEIGRELYREGERELFVQDGQTGQDVVPGQTFTGQDSDLTGQGSVDVQSLETSTEIGRELYREGERELFVQDGQTGQDVVPGQTFTGQDSDLTGQGSVDVQSLETSTEIGRELYREGERELFVQDGQTGQDVVPGQTFTGQDSDLTGQGSVDVQSLETSTEIGRELYREGERELFVQDGQTGQDVVPGQTFTGQDSDLTGQGSVDVQSLETSTEIGRELYREGERELFVQDGQTGQDVVPGQTFTGQDSDLTGQGSVDVQSLETSTEIGRELYREGERELFVQDGQTGQDVVPGQTFTGQDSDLTGQGSVDVQSLETSTEIGRELYREGERELFVQDGQTGQDVVPGQTFTGQDSDLTGQGSVDVQSLETSTEIGRELYREGERELFVQDGQTGQDVVPGQTFTGQDSDLTGQGSVDVQSLETSTEIGRELYREGERELFVQDGQTGQDVVPGQTFTGQDSDLTGQGSVDVQSLETSTEIGRELYREGERELFVQDGQTGQDVVPGQTFTGQDSDLTGQGSVDVQSLETSTEIGRELYREGERELFVQDGQTGQDVVPGQTFTGQDSDLTGQGSVDVQSLETSTEIGRELYREGERELFVQDGQTGQDVVPGQTFTGQDSDLTGQGSVDVQSLETSTEIGRELYREGERELFVQDGQTGQDVVPGQTFTGQDSDLTGQGSVDVQSLETSTEIGRELYREGERELFVQDGQTGQDVVPGQTFTGQDSDLTGQGSVDVQSLETSTEIGRELYREGERELFVQDGQTGQDVVPGQTFTGQDSDLTGQGSVDVQSLETSTEIGRELYREGERELFVQDGQTGQDVVPGQTFTGQDSDLTGQGSVDVQSLETSTEIGRELYREGERELFVQDGQTGQDVVPGQTFTGQDSDLTGQGSVDVQSLETSTEIGRELYREGERELFVQDGQTGQDVVPGQTFTGQDSDLTGQGSVDVQSLETSTEIGRELYREGERELFVQDGQTGQDVVPGQTFTGQDSDLTGQGSVDVQSLETSTEIGRELYREGERELFVQDGQTGQDVVPGQTFTGQDSDLTGQGSVDVQSLETSTEIGRELYREGERELFVQDGQTGQDVVPGQTFTGQDSDLTGQGSVDVQSLETSTEIGRELYREGERELFVQDGQTGQDVVPGQTFTGQDSDLTGQGSVDVQSLETSTEIGRELYREGERELFVQDGQTGQDVVPGQTFTGQDSDLTGQGSVDVQSLETSTEIGRELYREGERELFVQDGQTGQDVVPGQTFTGQDSDLTGQGSVDVQSLETSTEIGRELYREGERELFVQDGQTGQDVVPGQTFTGQDSDLTGQGSVDVQSLETSTEIGRELYREGERELFVQDGQTGQDVVPGQTFTGQDSDLTGQGSVDVQSLETSTEIGRELYREGERELFVQDGQTGQDVVPGQTFTGQDSDLTGQGSVDVQSLETSTEIGRELYREGERELFVQDGQTGQDVVPGQTFTGQDSDLTGQGSVDVQSLETSTEIGRELYREGERELFVQDGQTGQDVVPGQTFTGQDSDLTGQGSVDVQSLETSTEIGRELYREGERELFVQDGQTGQDVVPGQTFTGQDSDLTGQGSVDVQSLETSTEIGRELYREGERELFVQDGQTGQDVVPGQTFTGQDSDLTGQGSVDVQSLETSTEIGRELYREGERELFVQDGQTGQDVVPGQTFTGQDSDLTGQGSVDVQSLETSTEIGRELYREGERELFVQDGQTGQDVVPGQTFTGQDSDLTGQGSVDVQSLETSTEIGRELYREGERELFVQDGQTGQDVVPGQTFTGQDSDLTGQGSVDVQSLETSTEIGRELYREGERELFVQDGQTGQDVVPGQTFTGQDSDLTGQGSVDVQSLETSTEIGRELYREGERELFVQDGQTGQDVVPGQTFTGQDSDLTGQGSVDVQSLETSTEIGRELYREGERELFVQDGQTLGDQPASPDQKEEAYQAYRQGERNLPVQESSQQSNQFSNPIAQSLYMLGHGFKIAALPFSYLSNLYNYLLDGLFANNRKVESDNRPTSSVSANGLGVTKHQSKDIRQQILEKSSENFMQGTRTFLRAVLDKMVLNYTGINMNVMREIDVNLKFFNNINNLDQNLNLHGISTVMEALKDPKARIELLKWLKQLRQSKIEPNEREIERPNNPKLAEFIDIIEQMEIKDLDKIIGSIESLNNPNSNLNDSIAYLISSIWNVDKGLVSLLIQIRQNPEKANNLKSQLEKLYVESYFNKDNMRLSEEERRTYTIIYNILTTNMTMEEIHLVESINVLRKYELYRLFRQLEAEIGMDKEINAQDLQKKLRESLQSINDKYGLNIFTQYEIESHLSIGLNSNDIMLDPKIAKAFLKGLSMYYGSLGDIIDNQYSWAQESNRIFLLGIRSILDQKDIDENTRNKLIDISVRIMLNDENSLKRIIDTFRHSLSDELIQKLENRAKLIELIRKQYSRSSDTKEKMIYYSFMDGTNLDELLEQIFTTPDRIPNHLPKNKEGYVLNDKELTEFLKSALDANLFTLSLRVVENKNLKIPSLERVLPKYPPTPKSISEKTSLGFFYDTQDPAFITKLNRALVGNHFMGRIRGWTEVQQIETILTSFAYELIPLDYQISIVNGIVYIKKGDETIQTLRLDRPVENISEIRLLAKDGQIYLQYDDQILPTGIKIDPNEKIKQMRFMTKDGKLYAVYGDRMIELRWEDIFTFTSIMHRMSLYSFNLNSETTNKFIQQLIQEMGNGELSYEQFMNLLKQTKLKLKK